MLNVSGHSGSHFNPRSHEGSDILRHTFATRCIISIHAPTRGATIIGRCCHKYRRFQSTLPRGERRICTRERNQSIRFQSTLPRGERLKKSPKTCHPTIFQSTLPRGERLSCTFYDCNNTGHFNPRSHEGSDDVLLSNASVQQISIHAPTRGATAIFAKKFSFLSAKIV